MHDMPLLLQAESADPGDGVEDSASIYDLPVKGIWNGRIVEF